MIDAPKQTAIPHMIVLLCHHSACSSTTATSARSIQSVWTMQKSRTLQFRAPDANADRAAGVLRVQRTRGGTPSSPPHASRVDRRRGVHRMLIARRGTLLSAVSREDWERRVHLVYVFGVAPHPRQCHADRRTRVLQLQTLHRESLHRRHVRKDRRIDVCAVFRGQG